MLFHLLKQRIKTKISKIRKKRNYETFIPFFFLRLTTPHALNRYRLSVIFLFIFPSFSNFLIFDNIKNKLNIIGGETSILLSI